MCPDQQGSATLPLLWRLPDARPPRGRTAGPESARSDPQRASRAPVPRGCTGPATPCAGLLQRPAERTEWAVPARNGRVAGPSHPVQGPPMLRRPPTAAGVVRRLCYAVEHPLLRQAGERHRATRYFKSTAELSTALHIRHCPRGPRELLPSLTARPSGGAAAPTLSTLVAAGVQTSTGT
ncbi:hypothetical protein GL50803_00d60176 [Giardia duodenalis]|uniref:Uncharacterized protein n=1 Tax=Giardia intestinalis (strain ATCC 50803 / WB clone C6) TaxID=184922 RepID=A0A644F7X4_GIAIC|nr:hypothetical protein GL50803_00d60176 [Giardia intestinalis]KAE8304726.1 hypothetical protein GL50803_00d60176 [Giardia intestinalis]